MPPTGYIVDPEGLDALPPAQSCFLNPAQHNVVYMQIVGFLISIQLLCADIIFTTLYHIYNPIPIVLHSITSPTPFANGLPLHFLPLFGGDPPISLDSASDASLAIGAPPFLRWCYFRVRYSNKISLSIIF